MIGQRGFWDFEQRLEALSKGGDDPLERLSATVDFKMLRPILLRALRRSKRRDPGIHAEPAALDCRIRSGNDMEIFGDLPA